MVAVEPDRVWYAWVAVQELHINLLKVPTVVLVVLIRVTNLQHKTRMYSQLGRSCNKCILLLPNTCVDTVQAVFIDYVPVMAY